MNRTETRGGTEVVVCSSCGCFAPKSGGVMSHSSRCEVSPRTTERVWAPKAVPVAAAARASASEIARKAHDGTLGDDAAFDAEQAGLIGVSAAMNQDV